VNGNYQRTTAGSILHGFKFLLGAPGLMIDRTNTTIFDGAGKNAFNLIKAYLQENYVIGADTLTPSLGLKPSHVYSVLAAYTIVDSTGNSHNLIMLRNPLGNDI
jgi:hypothetical protein